MKLGTGQYKIGEDFPAGVYSFRFLQNGDNEVNRSDYYVYEKLLAFAGLDPTVRQSGKFNASRTRMSKRGSRVLRYALVYSAHNVVKNNETFRKYYDLKCSQGRGHYAALGHCAGKLVRIIYKILSENIAFDPSKL